MAESTLLTPPATSGSGSKSIERDIIESCDSPTATKTSSNTSSETASFAEDEADDTLLLTSLARQLEFYFSPANLPRDTYLQTLQGLNDGYVPVTILANFAKVQALCSSTMHDAARIQAAVTKAASHFSSALTVVSISTVTSKKVVDGTEDTTILAVGPRDNTAAGSSTAAPKSPIQNTIILRDVPAEVTEDDVRSLFENTSLLSVHLDVANCWFVTLDTTSREDVMNVMMDLRSKSLKGEPVKARLKAVVSASAPVFTPAALVYDVPPQSPTPASPPRKQKTKKQQSKQATTPKGSRSRRKSNKAPPSPSTAKKLAPPPLIKEEAHFPALVDSPVVDNMDRVAAPKPSDAASTATTSSTSSLVMPQPPVAGGYAAALLKQAAPQAAAPPAATPAPTPTASNTKVAVESKTAAMNKKPQGGVNGTSAPTVPKATVKAPEPKQEVPAVPLTWGSGRSFADVLKKEESSS